LNLPVNKRVLLGIILKNYRSMYTTIRSLLLFLVLAIMTTASAQTLTFRDILNRADRPTPDHKIAYGTHSDQYGELWLPASATANVKPPVVILVHGGCWRADLPGPELVAFLADALRSQGVAVWSITYRRVGTKAENFSPYPDTFRDVSDATDRLYDIARKHNLDLKRVVSTGHSAGGHLAMWLAARPRLPTESPLHSKTALPIHATVGIAAIADLQVGKSMSAHACGADTVDLLIDTKTRKETAFRDTSVTPLLPLGIPQTLVSGVYDAIVAPAQAWRYREQARAKSEVVKLVTLEDAGHFELISPWTPAGKRVVDEIIAAIPANR
jgi:acetyl esterase/lipase